MLRRLHDDKPQRLPPSNMSLQGSKVAPRVGFRFCGNQTILAIIFIILFTLHSRSTDKTILSELQSSKETNKEPTPNQERPKTETAHQSIISSQPTKLKSTQGRPSSHDRQERPSQCRYHISSTGKDGIGHQIEAKYSCLATALALNYTYVHQPITKLEHGGNATNMEALFGVSEVVEILPDSTAVPFNQATMEITRRKPLPKVDRCHKVSWFDGRDKMTPPCAEHGKKTQVYSADNCWDFFWCHVDSWADSWETQLGPLFRKSFLKSKVSPTFQKEKNTIYLGFHARRGDADERKQEFSWSQEVVQQLRTAASLVDSIHRVHLIVHTDGVEEEIKNGLGLMRFDNDKTFQYTVLGRSNVNIGMPEIMADLMMTDILVASDSSVSHVSALLRPDQKSVLHPMGYRPRSLKLGWGILNETQGVISRCVEPPPSDSKTNDCQGWEKVGQEYWRSIVQRAVTQEPTRFS